MALPFLVTKWLVRTGAAGWLPSVRRRLDGTAACLHYLSDRSLATPLDDLGTLADFWEADAPDAIDLALGAPRFDAAPSAPPRLPAHLRGYPPVGGLPELRAAVAEHCNGAADDALITPGAAGAFQLACDTFINAGDGVVLLDPTSPLFALTLRQRRARLRWVPSRVEDGQTRFSMEPFTKALPGAKLLVLADPANPTGGVLAAEDVEQIAWWANKYDVLIYVDESFARFRYEGEPARIAMAEPARRRTLLAGGVSKGHALASSRVGWLTGPRDLLRPCRAAAALSAPFVPTACQQLALAALRQGDEPFAPIKAEFAAKRQYTCERLRGLGFEPAWPAGGFTLWVPVNYLGMTGRHFAEELRLAKRVLVTPGEVYGPSGVNCIRLSYAIDDGRLREGLGRLAEFVGGLRQAPPHEEPDADAAPEERALDRVA